MRALRKYLKIGYKKPKTGIAKPKFMCYTSIINKRRWKEDHTWGHEVDQTKKESPEFLHTETSNGMKWVP